MKRSIYLTIIATFALHAQQSIPTIPDTSAVPGPWKHSVVGGLNMTQVGAKRLGPGGRERPLIRGQRIRSINTGRFRHALDQYL
ncbi:MAG: hypothetical protein WEB33_10260 [Bacteroidota bacterium]